MNLKLVNGNLMAMTAVDLSQQALDTAAFLAAQANALIPPPAPVLHIDDLASLLVAKGVLLQADVTAIKK